MASVIKVALSPYFTKPEGFTDEVSGIKFEHGHNGVMLGYDVSNAKLEGIRRAVRLNVLLLLEGELPEQEVPAPVIEKKEEAKVETPAEEVKAEVVEAPKEQHKGHKKVTK